MKTHTPKIYLDRNEITSGPAPECLEVLRNITQDELSYYTRDYSKGIKSMLSQRLAELNNLPEERVLLGYGSEDLIKQCIHCYLGPGTVLLKPELSWWYYDSVASEVAAKTHCFRLLKERRRFSFNADLILSACHRWKPSVLLISSPNNPTGNSIMADDLHTVLAETRQSIVVLDQAYYGFSSGNELSLTYLLEEFPNLVVLRTFSKLYGLAGARIGYAFAGKGASRLIRFSKKYLGYNRISEALALTALNARRYYQELRLMIEQQKHKYYESLGALPGMKVYESDASFVLVAFDPDLGGIIRQALSQNNIVVKFFDDDDIRLKHHMRISIGTPQENDLVIGTLSAALTRRKVAAA
ncbi:MAG: aminotransferase class I/II-fold pyridoxal phosphate-dependent enzyme [Ignavibacteriales bacterium]|nr:aminotransferase class I/II-fold pyridoxal phosphate-dependent enzyme [Ignavibacteriales bacterium]